jgi:hypothetical protein
VIASTGVGETGPRDHVVQFYRQDVELAQQAGAFLAEAIRDGGTAMAIATPPHRRALEARLAGAGIDVAAARARGDYVAPDAEEMLRRCVIGGKPDVGGFDDAVCSLIEGSAQRGQRVRIYGELVAVLRQSGQATAAIELEEMWIGLGRRLPFALWCGYPARDDGAGEVAEICRLHGEIVGPAPAGHVPSGADVLAGELSRNFAGSLDSIGPARRFVVAALVAGGQGVFADDAGLAVTELAANAVIHARSAFTVTISAGEDSVRLSVRDGAALPSGGGDPAFPAEPLHGLGAVVAMAAQWGTGPAASGKIVWAELRR